MLGLSACHDPRRAARGNEPSVGAAATASSTAHGSGRNRWRGGGVYLDGEPIGVLRHAELPRGLEPIWETQRRRLPFGPGEEVRFTETKVPRYRITDYLSALGLRLDDVVQVHLHGARDSAVVLTREDLRRHPDDLLFKFAGGTFGKPIPIIRTIPVGTTFDDLIAMTIYIERKPPRLTENQTLELDGLPIRGIPYHGEPLREGVRVYVDNRLATVLKRNQLPATSQSPHSDLGSVLARHGVPTSKLVSVELIHDEVRTATLPWSPLEFAFNEGASGEIVVGSHRLPANSIALFTHR